MNPTGGMPAWGSTPDFQAELGQSVGELAPLATTYHGAQTGVGINQIGNSIAQPGAPERFVHFLGGLVGQTGDVVGGVTQWLGQQTVNMATAPIRYGVAEAHGILDNIELGSINAQNQQLSARQDWLNSAYKSGRITKSQYLTGLDNLMQDQNNVSSQESALLHRLPADQNQAVQATIDTTATLITVLTAGFGKAFSVGVAAKGLEPLAAKTTADYLISTNANAFFDVAEKGIERIATDPEAFAQLSPVAQRAIQEGVGEVLSQSTTMSAGQIARASAVNLAFKYPIYYQWMSSKGQQLYSELDNKKYGDAVRTVAFNAALLLSGGPVGWALNKLGAGATILKNAVFTRTSFLDELSKAIGDGDPAGLFNAVNKISDPAIKADVVKQLSAVEATNVAAEGGDARAAAWRVIKGISSYEGMSLDQFTHEEMLNNMVNFAKAQRLADFYGKQIGKSITVGRLDARALDTIATGLTQGDEAAAALPGDIKAALPPEKPVDMTGAPDFLQPTGEAVKLPEPLQKLQDSLPQGYKVNAGGDVFGPDGKELTTGQVQDITQAPYLTEFEKATREGDIPTMERIAKEHPGDNRVNMGSVNKEPALASLTQEIKQSMMAKAKQAVAATEKSGLPEGYFINNEGEVIGPKGEHIPGSQVQQLFQPKFLTEFEQAQAKGDVETMNRIVAEHPGDERLSIPETTSPVARRMQAWEQLKASNPNQAWANNENLDRQIKALIQKHEDPSMLENAVRGIKASFSVPGLPAAAERDLAKMGYIPIKPVSLEAPFAEGAGKLTTRFAGQSDSFFTKAVQPLPVLSFIGDSLTRLGLSPDAAVQQTYQVFNDNLSKNLAESGVLKETVGSDMRHESDTLLKQLSDYAKNPTVGKITSRMPITDFRMLTTKDIQAATGMTAADSLKVQQAIGRAYIQVPLAIRGLGDRAVDILYSGPQSALARRYFRLQGALRFSWNPFFEYMRVIPKTEILTESEGGGVVNSIFTGRVGQINDVRQMLRDAGMFDTPGTFANVVSGEAADTDVISRNITKHLLPMQERSIAGLIISQSDRMGMSVEDYIHAYPQQARDTIQAIAQYDRNANFLNSPLARTLNVAIFPFRFETKVAGFMARGLARQPLLTQVAFVNGLMQAHAWFNSPEGMAWYSRHSTAIGFFNYITPFAEMDQVFEALLPGHDHSLGNFGELGGLPFGWIPQLTDAEGWTHFNQAGVDPTTGSIIPNYVPTTTRGQIAIAIQDFIGSLFSYPGAEAGLPSKTSITRNIALGMTGATKTSDMKLVTSAPNQQQINYQRAVQSASQGSAPQDSSMSQQPGLVPSQTVPGIKVPGSDSPILHPTPKASTATTKGVRKKKGQYIPALLPGQTTYGVL